jgi:DedD protein
MDEQLKARLIGASVLVLLAVLLIPELLSSRRPSAGEPAEERVNAGTRTFTIELGEPGGTVVEAGQGGAPPAVISDEAAAGTLAAGAERDQSPAPAKATAERADRAVAKAPPGAADPVKVVAAKQDPETSAKPVSVAAPTARAGWSVQVGAFRSSSSAQKLARDLTAAGYEAYVMPVARGNNLHRVRVGPAPDRSQANDLAARLKARGLPVAVVSNE